MKEQSTNKYNLLKVLELLDGKEVSKDEVLKSLNIKPSTFYKHLNSIKNVGFEIKKNDENYELIKFRKIIKFAKYELGIFAYLLLLASVMLSDKNAKKVNDILLKMIYLSDKEDYCAIQELFETYKIKVFEDCYSEKIAVLDKYSKDNKNIKILTKDNEIFSFQSLSVDWKKQDFYITFKDKKKTKSIALENVVKISEQIEKEIFEIAPKDEVIFEIYDKLMKSYLLREDERVLDNTKDKLVIASSNPDKLTLFSRLLRYGVLCKVVFPKADVKEFYEIIKKSLANIEEIQDNI